MKTTTMKVAVVLTTAFFSTLYLVSQEIVGTRIDVQSSQYSAHMWVCQSSNCTRGFDKGWDSYGTLRVTSAPQIFGMEGAVLYYIDAVPDFNGTYIGFKAGVDSIYTMTFTNQNLQLIYTQLFLVDSIARKTVDIFTSGTQYTFTARQTTDVVKRFKLYTSLPVSPPPPPPVVVNNTVIVDKATVTEPQYISNVSSSTVPGNSIKIKYIRTEIDSHGKSVKVYSSNKVLYVDCMENTSGSLLIYNTQTGRLEKSVHFKAQSVTAIPINFSPGVYIVKGFTGTSGISGKIMIQ